MFGKEPKEKKEEREVRLNCKSVVGIGSASVKEHMECRIQCYFLEKAVLNEGQMPEPNKLHLFQFLNTLQDNEEKSGKKCSTSKHYFVTNTSSIPAALVYYSYWK